MEIINYTCFRQIFIITILNMQLDFANTSVWNATTGYNDLNQIISILSTGCTNTVWDGNSWSAGLPLPNGAAGP